jgi:hypothetical protein
MNNPKLKEIELEKEFHCKKDGTFHQGYMNIFKFQSTRDFLANLRNEPIEIKIGLYKQINQLECYTPKKHLFKPDKKVVGDNTYKVGVLSCDTSIACVNRCKNCALGGKCYADEVRPSNLKYSMARAIYFNETDVKQIASDLKAYNVDVVRLNEAGDFTTLEQVEKVISLAKMMPNVTFYGYTKSEFARIKFEEVFNDVKNLIIHDSLGISKILPHFITIQKKEDLPQGYHLCKGECKKCKCCYNKNLNKGCIEH